MVAPTVEGVIHYVLAAEGGVFFSGIGRALQTAFAPFRMGTGREAAKASFRRRRRGIFFAAAHRTRSRAVLIYNVMPHRMHLNAQNCPSRRPTDFDPPFFKVFARLLGEAARIQRRVALAALRRVRNSFCDSAPDAKQGGAEP